MGRPTKPLVSILTPSFNQGRFIGDCLQSVVAQTYQPIEHIVMDGGSTDETVALLEQSGDHVRWTSEPDRGQSHALNKAFAASSGDVIGWINSDDAYADRRTVEWAVEGLKYADIVFGHALLINEGNDILQVLASAPFVRGLVEAVHYPVQPTFFFRRSALEEQGFLDDSLRYVMDRDLFLRLSRRFRIKHLSRTMAVDRHQANRKVLSQSYLDEAAKHDEQLGITDSLQRKVIAAVTRLTLRAYGIPLAISLDRSLEPAIDLHLASMSERLVRQCLVRRRDMAFHELEASH